MGDNVLPEFDFRPRQRRKRVNPHKLLGTIVLYGFAADDAIRVVNWLVRSLIHELWK
jgi:hypothetical protein